MSKKILIVSSSFYPQNSPRSFRTTELAKELASQGHRVTILTPFHYSQEEFAIEHNLEVKDLGKVKWRAFELKGNNFTVLFKRGFNRLSSLLFEYPNIELMTLVKKALKKESGYDLLISIAFPFPVHWGVARVWNTSKPEKNPAKVWVADCGDPFYGQENDSFKLPFYWGCVEMWFMRKTDFVTVPTQGAIQAYFPEFHSKIRVIPQGFRFEDIQIHSGGKINDLLVFGYAGSFIPGIRDPGEFLSYLCSLDDHFEFHIYTSSPQFVLPFVEKSKDRIKLKALLPRQSLLYELSKMDFVVNFENIGSKQTPSKLIDYAIINKPILSIKTGELNKVIVQEFLSGNYRNAYVVNNPDQYRIQNVARAFIELCN
ncbi:MAG: glycosyltransferase [Cecembia sp.]